MNILGQEEEDIKTSRLYTQIQSICLNNENWSYKLDRNYIIVTILFNDEGRKQDIILYRKKITKKITAIKVNSVFCSFKENLNYSDLLSYLTAGGGSSISFGYIFMINGDTKYFALGNNLLEDVSDDELMKTIVIIGALADDFEKKYMKKDAF